MAVGTRDRDVSSSQDEVCLLVLGQGKCGRLVAFQIVTTITGIEIGRGGKLSGMAVAMAIGAALELHFEKSVLSFREMTLHTLDTRMLALQWVGRGGMLLHREGGRPPSLHGMARSALSAIRALGKLALVRIRLMAVHTLGENQRLLEITIGMAFRAINTDVFAFQRKFRFGMIEALVHRRQRNFLPTTGVMAGLASLRKAAAVRVLVTISALIKRDTHILRLAIRPIDVALGALHLSVHAGQGIPGFVVIELRDINRLPVRKVMTGLAI